MSKINENKINGEIVEFCRFPVPKTPIDIVRHLKGLNSDFYPKTPDKQVVKFLRERYLNKLVDQGFIVRYDENSGSWKKARRLLSFFESNSKSKPTRKVKELYQANFLNFFDTGNSFLLKMPSFKEINLDLVVLLYNSMKNVGKEIFKANNFSFELINLMMAYRDERLRDKIRISLYSFNFTDKEIESFEKLLEYSLFMKEFFENIPFKPDEQKAIEFIKKINKSKK